MIWDTLIKLFDPLINQTYKADDKNWLYYTVAIVFVLFLALVGYLLFNLFT